MASHGDPPVAANERSARGSTTVVVAALLIVAAAVVGVVVVTVARSSPTSSSSPPSSRGASTAGRAVVYDDFGRPDGDVLGAPTNGRPWTIEGGPWGIEDQTARLLEPSGALTLALTRTDQTYDRVEVTLSAVGPNAGIVFRFEDVSNYWALTAVPELGTFSLAKVVDGHITLVSDLGLTGTDDGTRIGVSLDGPRVGVLLNGSERVAIDDGSLQDAQTLGLIGTADDDLRARFDDFLVSVR